MAYLDFFLKGALSGLAIAAPVGPTTVLVLHRTVKHGWACGLKSGLGAAVADAFFGLLAAFGVSFIVGFVDRHVFAIKLIGGCFLLFWGARIFVSRFAESHPLVKGQGAGGPVASTFLLTLTNPMTILAFMAVLAGLGAAQIKTSPTSVMQWIAGLAIGSFIWWLFLSLLTHGLKEKFSLKVLAFLNRVMGAIVILAGAFILLNILK